MPMYDLQCACGAVTEYFMGMNDMDVDVECPECGETMTRRVNRIMNIPIIQAGGGSCGQVDYNYFDDSLDTHITSKGHRQRVMEEKGLVDYAPDPTMKKHRDEASKIRRESKVGDPEAAAAINKEYKTALDVRRNRNIKKSLDKSFKDLGLQK